LDVAPRVARHKRERASRAKNRKIVVVFGFEEAFQCPKNFLEKQTTKKKNRDAYL